MNQGTSLINQRSKAFRQETQELSSVVEEIGLEPLVDLHGAVVDAVDLFGQAELYIRKAKRRETMEIEAEAAKAAQERGEKYQQAGFDLLDSTSEQIDAIQSELSDLEPENESAARETATQFETEFRNRLVDLEIKPSDVEEIFQVTDEAIEVGLTGSADRFSDYTTEAIDRLYNTRSRRDRGTESNLAPWKKAAIVAVFGVVAAAVIIACYLSGGLACVQAIRLGIAGAAAAASIVQNFC